MLPNAKNNIQEHYDYTKHGHEGYRGKLSKEADGENPGTFSEQFG